MKTRSLTFVLVTVIAIGCMAGAFAQQNGQKLYKWVDKNGVVHYGSSVPPQYANQQLQVLNNEGITVKTIAAPKTAAQVSKEKKNKAEAAIKAKQEQQQQATDQMLLDTYTSTADIERDRKDHIAAIDTQIKVIEGSIKGLTGTLTQYQQQEARLTHAHKPLPAPLKKNMQETQEQLTADQQLLVTQQKQKQATQERYNAYLKRFEQLSEQQSGGNQY